MNLKIKRGGNGSSTLRKEKSPGAPRKDSGSSALMEIHPVLDYPQQNEKITSKHYTFRISVPGPVKNVEVSISQGPWQPCRNSVGYWWFDWSNYGRGAYKAVVRAQTADGQKIASEPREFIVEIR